LDPTLKPRDPREPAEVGESAGNRLAAAWQEAAGREREQEELFRQIFHTYYRAVHAFFAKRGFPPDDCGDLVQETFFKVHKGLSAFRREARFETWLFQITANVFHNVLRSRSTQKREAVEVPLDDGAETEPSTASPMPGWSVEGDPLHGVLAAEKSRLLREAMDGLPAQMRRCVLMRIDQDLRYREIADLLRVSIDTVKAHLYQARQQLKSKLGAYFAESDFSDG
jgi:RNA polymerase sigma-70 factor (ECF subfamily)